MLHVHLALLRLASLAALLTPQPQLVDNDKIMPPTPPQNERRWTIDRFNSALNSESKQTRVDALNALLTVVSNLSETLTTLRELDLPPPYDPSRIVLTHKQGSMVSDMARGEHAPHWAAWQKTQSGLMSQFLEDKTNQPLQPPKRDDVDEDGDALAPLTSAANMATENQLRRQLQFLLDGTAKSLFKRFSGEEQQETKRRAEKARLRDVDVRLRHFRAYRALLTPRIISCSSLRSSQTPPKSVATSP